MIYLGALDDSAKILTLVSSDPPNVWDAGDIEMLSALPPLYRLDFDTARQHLETALKLFTSISAVRDIHVCWEYLGWLHYLQGDYAAARQYYMKILSAPEPTASAVAQTLRLLTDVYVAESEWSKASETAVKAEAAITKINERIELGALNRAYGQIHSHSKDHEKARECFGKSIAILREIGARYELALTYMECGKSDAFAFDDRQSHLVMAKSLFEEMRVPKRVEQVEKILTALATQSRKPVVECKSRSSDNGFPIIIAVDPRMRKIVEYAEEIAPHGMNVLLTGETGTGKDLLAKYIHCCSGRTGEFVSVNAAAIPHEMFEAELFGCRRGAFTGANEDRAGLLEAADKGTFYLNEVAEIGSVLQTKLLQVLEEREIRRLGENHRRRVDFRLISATNHDIAIRTRQRLFRQDLLYRINEISITLPPLRDRPEDIVPLIRHFCRQLELEAGEQPDERLIEWTTRILVKRLWPGNVRELQSEVHRLWLSSRGGITGLLRPSAEGRPRCDSLRLKMALEEARGNRREAARLLGVSEKSVRNWMAKTGIKVETGRRKRAEDEK